MSISNRTLQTAFTGVFSAQYRKLDEENASLVADDVRYGDLKTLLINGNGNFKANLLFKERRTLAGGVTQLYNLDGGIENVWGDLLNFDSVKTIIIFNRSTTLYDNLELIFKNERANIGPQGKRVIIEPYGKGLEPGAGLSSSSFEEGTLSIENTSDNNIEYDIFIVGSDQEESTSE